MRCNASRKGLAFTALFLLTGCGGEIEQPISTLTKDAIVADSSTSSEAKSPSNSNARSIGNVVLKRVDSEYFSSLPQQSKRLAYQYYLTSTFGEDLYYRQRGAEALRIRRMLLGIIGAGEQITSPIRNKILPYARRFFLSNGVRDQWTCQKIHPTFIPGELAAAAQAAIEKGIDLGVTEYDGAGLGANRLDQLVGLLDLLRPCIFDSQFEPQAPKGPFHIALAEQIKPLAKRLRGDNLSTGNAVKAFGHFADYLETGEKESLAAYYSKWTRIDEPVELVLGFSQNGNCKFSDNEIFFAMVAIRDEDRTQMLRRVAAEAAYFERQLPVNAMYKRTRGSIIPTTAGAYKLIYVAGGGAHLPLDSISLPADPIFRREFGYKSLIFSNSQDTAGHESNRKRIREFSIDEDTAFRREKWLLAGQLGLDSLKEVIGRGAAEANIRNKRPESTEQKLQMTSLDELRSELVALYLVFDKKNTALGLIPEKECAQTVYDEYVSQYLEQITLINTARETAYRTRAHNSIVQRILASGAAEITKFEGKFYARVLDYNGMRKTIGAMLDEVQRAWATGDYSKAQSMLKIESTSNEWHTDIQRRLDAIGLPEKETALLYPRLVGTHGTDGEIVNVETTVENSTEASLFR
jgi:hypothetical protein